MKKLISIITALTIFAGSAIADEGMWLLPLLEKMNGKAMKELGCELTPKQIYDINNTSLKDAIVQFGGGCTGEIISKDGLLVTNHHCGYSNIQKLSSVEHDYLKDGYWAMNRSEELPCEGLTVTFLEYMQDITGILEKVDKKGWTTLKFIEITPRSPCSSPRCTRTERSGKRSEVIFEQEKRQWPRCRHVYPALHRAFGDHQPADGPR